MRYLLQDEPEKGRRWVYLLVGASISACVWGGGLYAAGRTAPTQRDRAQPIRVQMVRLPRPTTAPSVAKAPITIAPKSAKSTAKRRETRRRKRRSGRRAVRPATPRSVRPATPRSVQPRPPTTEPVRLGVMLERPSPEGLPRGDAAGEGKGDAVGDRRGDAAVGKATETGSGRAARRVPVRKDARALKKVRPAYTRAALRANIEGRVRFQVLVGQDGRVRHARLIKGLGYGLDERALEAVRRWRFQPATVDGVPVESRRYVNVDFSIRE